MTENNRVNYKEALIIGSRVFQAIFFGVFLLGISMMTSDVIPVVIVGVPLSPLSVNTTTDGILGMLACEFLARRFTRNASKIEN